MAPKSRIIVPSTNNRRLKTVNIVTSTAGYQKGEIGTFQQGTKGETVQDSGGIVKGLPTICVPGYSSGGGSYIAKAIHFAGASDPDNPTGLQQLPMLAPDSSKFTMSFWTQFTSVASFPRLIETLTPRCLASEIGYNFSTDVTFAVTDGTHNVSWGSANGVYTINSWHNIFCSCDLNHAQGAKSLFLYMDALSIRDPANDIDDGGAMVLPFSTCQELDIDSGDPQDMADFMMWIGKAIDPSVPANLAKFISSGKPVDPAVAVSAFGTPDYLCSGDHANFAINQGTAGALTLLGSLTNASTSPSD